ncbi:MFS transporter [Dactylosporangium sp. NBC_01737]|uniref:MFS transporter n=1 Tax=Dactylosporangium sp. NBC_01737 TaxID=2975959 RepID=UPI002E1132DB|nr:MFS transporter [Dactylosporangium sp. NBC_01737]
MHDTLRRPRLPAALRLLLAGDVVSAVGIGLTQPYLVILLHSVKGVPLVTATAMTSLLALASFPGNWLSGALADRYRGHRVMTGGLAVTVCGLVLVATGEHLLLLGCAVAAVGFGWSVTLPAYATLIAGLVPQAAQGRAFTLQFALFNAGMGAGSAAGVLVGIGDLTALWWVAAATCLVAVGAVWAAHTRTPTGAPATAVQGTAPAAGGGYRALLADRALLRVLLVALLMSAAGYGVYNAGLPVVAVTGGDPGAMSWASVANCLTIVAGLPLALRAGARLRPPQLIAAAAAVWSASWLLCAVEARSHLLGAGVTLPLAAVLVGAGELLLAGALPALVNALAPEALRGRYNAALTLAMTSGMWAGPLLAAAATGLGRVWLLFAAAVALLAVVTLLVRRPARTAPVPDLQPATGPR